ncbi:MAG: hypothetical protein OH316_00115 [Candidatus Parvarchaeota archaeon]|nr:hypothetical protein [Candidatus Parvarchaeota archaeon]MCW1301533.1 hypothetical protein [Candidatus Parvarchaeota archaeon]
MVFTIPGAVVLVVFSILAVLGFILLYFMGIILAVINKHKDDKAPFTSFMLHPDDTKKEIDKFLYVGVAILLTGIFTITQKLLGPVNLNNPLILVTYLLAYVFGIVSAVLVVYIGYRWYRKFKRFL